MTFTRQSYCSMGSSVERWLILWRHPIDPPVTSGFPFQRVGNTDFDVFYVSLNKKLNKPSSSWWFETPWRSLWCHCNVWCFTLSIINTTMSSHDRQGVSNHRQLDCLLHSLLELTSKYTSNSRTTGILKRDLQLNCGFPANASNAEIRDVITTCQARMVHPKYCTYNS